MKKLMVIMLVLALAACSTVAELERPEDTTVIRGSSTTLSPVVKWVTGGTDVCQITILDKTVQENQEESESSLTLIEDYEVNLNDGVCIIRLRFSEE